MRIKIIEYIVLIKKIFISGAKDNKDLSELN
jgi:hypothetical protein